MLKAGTRVQLAFDDAARVQYVAAFDEFALGMCNVALRNGGRYVGIANVDPDSKTLFSARWCGPGAVQ